MRLRLNSVVASLKIIEWKGAIMELAQSPVRLAQTRAAAWESTAEVLIAVRALSGEGLGVSGLHGGCCCVTLKGRRMRAVL